MKIPSCLLCNKVQHSQLLKFINGRINEELTESQKTNLTPQSINAVLHNSTEIRSAYRHL